MEFDENLASLHGYLCGDGYVTRNKKSQRHKYYIIGFRNTDVFLLEDFQRKFNKTFGLIPKISKDKDRCKIGNKNIYLLLTENFSYYSYEWSLPKLSKQNLSYWLRSFFDCEAWVENQSRKSRLISLDCCNEKGLLAVKESLDKFGINSSIAKKGDRDIFRLTICGLNNLKRFRDNIGFLHPDKNKKLIKAINSYVNYYWNIPSNKEDLMEFIKSKGKVRNNNIRFFSIKLRNLNTLKKILNIYAIKSRILGPWINNYGSLNYSLVLRKEDLWNKINQKKLRR